VRRLHEAQPAVLVEGDAAPAELHLEVEAVVRGPEEHRLPAQVEPLLAPLEDAPRTNSVCSASSAQVTSSGRSPDRFRDRGSLGWRSRAWAMTRLVASSSSGVLGSSP
jgi:hypothetical protein